MSRINFAKSILCIALALATFAALRGGPESASASAPASAHSNPVIVRLVGRELTVTIRAGPKGASYSAADRNGVALASNLSLDQLREQRPDLYRQIQPALCAAADADGDREPIGDLLWAGADRD